jgi:NAD(P)-dependent dehydrogenase (short-subunit alcohol dehydrogenase family)
VVGDRGYPAGRSSGSPSPDCRSRPRRPSSSTRPPPYDGVNAYGAAKAAEWSLANGIRIELASQETLVTALHLAGTDNERLLWPPPTRAC